jgi:hypothetical protein
VNHPVEIDITFCRLGLIVLDKHGALYRSQVFGHCCAQVAVRGFFVPLDETFPEFVPESIEEALGSLLGNLPYLSESQADEVDAVLARYRETEFLRVDRAMLRESGEAWVYVDVTSGGGCPLEGSGPWKGVLVWPNSD